MKKKTVLLSIIIIAISLSIILKINITQYKFSLNGEVGDYSSTLKSNFYEVSYYLFDKQYSFDFGKAKFRVYSLKSNKELDKLYNVEVEFNFDPYFSGTHTSSGTITENIVKVDYGEIIKSLNDGYLISIRTNNSTEVIEILLDK